MRTINHHPKWLKQPLRLTEEDRQNLFVVLDNFFSCYSLQDVREMLWDWLVTALASDSSNYDNGTDRSNLIFLYENLETLVEAAYLLMKKQESIKNNKEKAN